MMSRNADEGPGDEPRLAALADGSLGAAEREELEARVAGSPELQARLAEQQRALTLMARAASEVDAPARLRARIEARRRPARRQRFLPLAGLAVAAAAVLLAVLAAWPGGAGGPSVAQAAELGLRPSTESAPAVSQSEPKLLVAQVEGVAFPAWAKKFGWKAAGQRADRLDGRATRTVFYVKHGKRIAYTIVGGHSLKTPEHALTREREGTQLHVLHRGGRTIVTWLRGGHSCVLSGSGVPDAILLKLAAWHGKGAVAF